jgi:hypothetical protein
MDPLDPASQCQHIEETQDSPGGHFVSKASDKMVADQRQDLTELPSVLEGVSYEQLVRDVESFAHEHQLRDILPDLVKGALVAQNPRGFEQISELDEIDRQHLRDEITHKWKHPRALYFTIVLNSIATAVQGWDVTGSNGANLSFPQDFGIDDSGPNCTAAGTCLRNSWLIGVINSFPFLTIAFL